MIQNEFISAEIDLLTKFRSIENGVINEPERKGA
jgi:hypothetical protein